MKDHHIKVANFKKYFFKHRFGDSMIVFCHSESKDFFLLIQSHKIVFEIVLSTKEIRLHY